MIDTIGITYQVPSLLQIRRLCQVDQEVSSGLWGIGTYGLLIPAEKNIRHTDAANNFSSLNNQPLMLQEQLPLANSIQFKIIWMTCIINNCETWGSSELKKIWWVEILFIIAHINNIILCHC